MSITFGIEISMHDTLTIQEIWPDGDAPEEPTVEDVRALLLKDYDVHGTCADWGFEIRKEDVRITRQDEDEFRRRLEAAQQRAKEPRVAQRAEEAKVIEAGECAKQEWPPADTAAFIAEALDEAVARLRADERVIPSPEILANLRLALNHALQEKLGRKAP